MKIGNNRIFYVYFYFGIISIAFLNSCKAQSNRTILEKVDTYFEQLNRKSVQLCIDGVSDLSQFIKQRNNRDMHKYLLKSCEEEGSHYKLYKADTEKLLSTIYKNESSDFIIVNMVNPDNNRFLINTSTLTFSRKKNDQKVNIINNKYKFNQSKQRYELIKDSSIPGFDVEQKMKLIEDYFYFNKENSISDKSRHQSVSEMYYVIAKINNECVIKTLYDYSKED
jgi:hypothetical protein